MVVNCDKCVTPSIELDVGVPLGPYEWWAFRDRGVDLPQRIVRGQPMEAVMNDHQLDVGSPRFDQYVVSHPG